MQELTHQGPLLNPDMNRRLANDTRYTVQCDRDILTTNEESSSSTGNFLHPRDLRERVLKKDVNWNMLVLLEGKKNVSAHKSKIKNNVQRPPKIKTLKIAEDFPRRM